MPRLELTRHRRIQAQGLGCVKECYQKGARDETWCAQTTSCLLLLPRLPSLRRAHRLVPRLHPGFSDVQDIPSLFNVIEELETALSLGSKSGSTRNKSGSGWTTTRRRPDFPRVNETSDRVTVEVYRLSGSLHLQFYDVASPHQSAYTKLHNYQERKSVPSMRLCFPPWFWACLRRAIES